MFEEDGDEPYESDAEHGPWGVPEDMMRDARDSTMPPLTEGGTYDASDRESFWTAIAESLNQNSQSDHDTKWFAPSGHGVHTGVPGGNLEKHLFELWGDAQSYNQAREVWRQFEDTIKTGATLPATLSDAIPEAGPDWSDEYLSNFGKSAGEIADMFYPIVLAAKRIGDARRDLKAPPKGSDEDIAGKWGELLGDAGRAALDALDKCASQVTNGDYSGCKPDAAADAEEGVGKDNKVQTLGFKEQCFLLSKVSTVASWKADAFTGPTKDWKQHIRLRKRWPYLPSLWNPAGGTNACIQVQSDPFTFINQLAIYPDTQKFLTMPSEEIANLQPIIRFYKVTQRPDGQGEIQIPIHFDTDSANDLRNFMQGGSRNIGVGIENFQVKFQGTNPFAAKKDLTAKLTIFASSFAELVRPRYVTKKGAAAAYGYRKFQYVDLALKTDSAVTKNNLNSKNKSTTTNVVSGLDFSIRAVIGVNKPGQTVSGDSDLLGPLSRNFVTLEMIPTIHSFDFNEDGSVKFEINYKPFVNENFSSTAYDVFATEDIVKFLLASDIISTSIIQNCDVKTAAEFKRAQVEKIKDIQKSAINSLIKSVVDQGVMRYLWIPASLLKKINREGPLFDFAEIEKAKMKLQTQKGVQLKSKVAKAASKSKEAGKKGVMDTTAINPNSAGIQFMYLSDLIDVMLAGIDKRMKPDNITAMINDLPTWLAKAKFDAGRTGFDWESPEVVSLINQIKQNYIKEYANFKKLRIVLGPIELIDPINPSQVKIVNLGDLPVSVKYFTEFLTAEVLKKGRRQFPLNQCVDKLINKMVSSFLNNDSCFNGSVKQRTFFRKTSFVAYKPPSVNAGDPLTARLLEKTGDISTRTRIIPKQVGGQPLLDVVGCIGDVITNFQRPTYMYSVFYVANALPIDMFAGDQASDAARGVHHYSVGRDSGIIREIKLVRDKRKGIAEARYAQDGFNGLTQLREMYHVEISTVANMSVYPGMKIFVDPSGWVPVMDPDVEQALGKYTNLTDYGIGGYYDVMEVEHFFGPGTFETKFTAKWTAQTSTTTPAAPAEASASPAKPEPQKCTIWHAGKKGGDAKSNEIPDARKSALEKSLETSDASTAPMNGPSQNPEYGPAQDQFWGEESQQEDPYRQSPTSPDEAAGWVPP